MVNGIVGVKELVDYSEGEEVWRSWKVWLGRASIPVKEVDDSEGGKCGGAGRWG